LCHQREDRGGFRRPHGKGVHADREECAMKLIDITIGLIVLFFLILGNTI